MEHREAHIYGVRVCSKLGRSCGALKLLGDAPAGLHACHVDGLHDDLGHRPPALLASRQPAQPEPVPSRVLRLAQSATQDRGLVGQDDQARVGPLPPRAEGDLQIAPVAFLERAKVRPYAYWAAAHASRRGDER